MSGEDQSARTPRFSDRSTGLSIFGFLQIAMGGFAALLVPLMLLSVMFNPQPGAASAAQIIPVAGTYSVIAVVLVWLGINDAGGAIGNPILDHDPRIDRPCGTE